MRRDGERRQRQLHTPLFILVLVVGPCWLLVSLQLFRAFTRKSGSTVVLKTATATALSDSTFLLRINKGDTGHNSKNSDNVLLPVEVQPNQSHHNHSNVKHSLKRESRGREFLGSTTSILPTCLCPRSCDLKALSKRNHPTSTISCLQSIYLFRRQRRSGELLSCQTAVKEGYCSADCSPGVCRSDSEYTATYDYRPPAEQFRRYDKVVVVTKVFGPELLSQLKQMLCLFHSAYNHRVNYDIVVFSTLPWRANEIQELQSVIPNTKLTVTDEGPSLDAQLARMSEIDREHLNLRCGVVSGEKLTWYHRCVEMPGADEKYEARLSYAWQAEFRAKFLWKAQALAHFKYMLWLDSDALCSEEWKVDPMKIMIENDLILMFDNIPGDYSESPELKQKIQNAYGRTVCDATLTRDGAIKSFPCGNDIDFVIPFVHGFLHITNLDFYRKNASRFLDLLVGSQRFSRKWDDQVAVTVPAVMDAPDRSWDMRSHGIHLNIFHNGCMDGKRTEIPASDGSYISFWNDTIRLQWHSARERCDRLVLHTG